MARPNLIHPDQPRPIRVILHLYQFAASLKLAVVLILWVAVTLAVGTFVEAAYGTPVAQYGVYQTFWFNLMLILLAVNIFCAASIRFPWKRHQTGFVITHIGLLTLLFGTALSRIYGIDAQLLVYEYSSDKWAVEDNMHFEMVLHEDTDKSPDEIRRDMRLGNLSAAKTKILKPVGFNPGFFNWRDYDRIFTLATPQLDDPPDSDPIQRKLARYVSGWMFRVAQLTSGVHPNRWVKDEDGDFTKVRRLYDKDGVKLEVVDFLSDSKAVNAPMITVAMTPPRTTRMNANGKQVKSRYHWMKQDINIVEIPGKEDYPYGASDKGRGAGGSVSFRMTDRPAEKAAFLMTTPKGDLGQLGQVVLYADGKTLRFNVEDKQDAGKFPLEGTRYSVELANYWPSAFPVRNEETGRYEGKPDPRAQDSVNPAVKINLFKGEEQLGRLLLFSDQPNLNIYAYDDEVYGSYWFDHSKKDKNVRMRNSLGNRIDILQVDREKVSDQPQGSKSKAPTDDQERFVLYYRLWNNEAVQVTATVAPNGAPEDSLASFTMADELRFFVDKHVPADKPKVIRLPIDFKKDKPMLGPMARQPAAKVRVTLDDAVEEIWVETSTLNPDVSPIEQFEHVVVAGKNRKLSLMLRVDAVDVGFRVKLKDFERRLDPGTSQAAHYSSTVDFVPWRTDRNVGHIRLDGSVRKTITIPEPLDVDSIINCENMAVSGDGKLLYWCDSRQKQIFRLKLDDDKAEPQVVVGKVDSPARPVAVAIDDENEEIYWLEYVAGSQLRHGSLRRANLLGEDDETVTSFSGKPVDLVVDNDNQRVFWCYETSTQDRRHGAMGSASFDGADVELDWIEGMSVPSSLAIDHKRGRLYWTEPDESAIRSTDLLGDDPQTLSVDTSTKQRPDSVAIDETSGQIFWTDLQPPAVKDDEDLAVTDNVEHKIWVASLKGEDSARTIVTESLHQPRSLIVIGKGDEARLWFSQNAVLRHDVWITMNAPVEFVNPRNGDAYRIFQESFDGPYKPGDTNYEALVPENSDVPELYGSVLTFNHDPGRAIRNLGCLLVVVGIAAMFYMRAYFFRPRGRVARAVTPATLPRTTSNEDSMEEPSSSSQPQPAPEVVS